MAAFTPEDETRTALRDASGSLSYRGLHQRVNCAIDQLRDLHTKSSNTLRPHVLVVLDHSTHSVVALLAASGFGTAIPVTPQEVTDGHIESLPFDLALAPDGFDVESLHVPVLRYNDLKRASAETSPVNQSTDRPSLLVSTSGTTGDRKWVAHSSKSLEQAAILVAKELSLSREDVTLSVMPLNHTHGLVTTLLAPLFSGGTVFLAAPHNVSAMRTALSADISCVSASPTLHRYILKVRQLYGASEFSPDRIRIASDTLTPQLLGDLLAAYSAPVIDSYALTELPGTIVTRTLNDQGDFEKPYKAAPTVKCKVANDDSPLESGGELLADGPHRMCGFYDIENREVIEASKTGLVASGDLFEFHTSDRYSLVGRVKEMINRGGETIAPNYVERIATNVEGVTDALAFGEKHDSLGESISIALTASSAFDPDNIRAEVLRAIPARLHPVSVHLVRELAFKENGKIDRNSMRKRIHLEKGCET